MAGHELRATYRLQLGPGLGFAQAGALVPYLRELGVSHLYLSPSLQARAGSTHGYDVVDPTRLSVELGGERGFRELAGAGLGVILDIVPNHMGTGEENRWWTDPELRERFFDIDPAGGYRRFFDIDEMAAIRQEREEVFEVSHGKVLELLSEGLIDGLRVDHPDGLADPAGYLAKLRERGVARVWVEKILNPAAPRERLREWPVSGTVGYEFLNDVCALFVDPAAEKPLTELLREVTGEERSFAQIALEAQLEQARGAFAGEVARLQRLGPFQAATLEGALAGLPVYRTYVEPWSGTVERADREAVAGAGADERLARALLLESEEPIPEELVTRFQQTSPAITAKGVEDTAFYRYPRLLCLNEVGGDPERFGLSVADFHRANLERAERFPEGLLVTQTHDTKRSGDARARIGALSMIPGEWARRVRAWMAIGDRLRKGPGARLRGPDRQEELMLYQTLIGVWPTGGADEGERFAGPRERPNGYGEHSSGLRDGSNALRERLDAHLVKALREAKRNSSWAQPEEAWEAEVIEFTHRLLDSEEFLADFEPFAARVAAEGERSALGQLLLKLTCPGIPDIYQGDELWRLSLVDPDNRRAVDWVLRRGLLDGLRNGAQPTVQTVKLALIQRTLDLRRRRPEAFQGPYVPLEAGPDVCAFMRGDQVLVTVEVRPGGDWRLQNEPGEAARWTVDGTWREVLGGRETDFDRARSAWELSRRELVDRNGLALWERV